MAPAAPPRRPTRREISEKIKSKRTSWSPTLAAALDVVEGAAPGGKSPTASEEAVRPSESAAVFEVEEDDGGEEDSYDILGALTFDTFVEEDGGEEREQRREPVVVKAPKRAALGSSCSMTISTTASTESRSLAASAGDDVLGGLEGMLIDRTSAIQKVRTFIEAELKQDDSFMDGLMEECPDTPGPGTPSPDKVAALEREIASRDGTIVTLTKNVDDLKAKNGDYARELRRLSNTVMLLVDSNTENIDRAVKLEEDAARKKDAIAELEGEVKARQSIIDEGAKERVDLARQLEAFRTENDGLRRAAEEMVDGGAESMERVVELEEDAARKRNAIAELEGEIAKKQSLLEESTEESASLARQLETFRAENDGLRRTVEDLRSGNDEYTEKMKELVSSLKEVVDQNEALEAQAKGLIAANDKLEKKARATAAKNMDRYRAEVRANEKLRSEREGMRRREEEAEACARRAAEEHEAAVDAWEVRLKFEEQAMRLLKEEMESLRNELRGERETREKLEADAAIREASLKETIGTLEEIKRERDDNADALIRLEKGQEDTAARYKGQVKHLEERVAGLEGSLEEETRALEEMTRRNEGLREEIRKEREDGAAIKNRLEMDLKDTVARYEGKVSGLAALLEEARDAARTAHAAESAARTQLQKDIAEVRKSASKALKKQAAKIVILEKGLEDELFMTAKLKEGHEVTKKKYHRECERNGAIKLEREEMKASAAKMAEDHRLAVEQMAEERRAVAARMERESETAAEEHRASTAKMERDLEAKAKANARLAGEVDGLAKELGDERRARAALESELGSAEEARAKEKADLTDQLKSFCEMADRLEEKASSLAGLLEQSEGSRKREAEKNADLARELEGAEQAAAKAARESASAIAALEKVTKDLEDVSKQLKDEKIVTAQLKEVQERLYKTERHLSHMTRQKEQLTEKLGEMKERNEGLKIEVVGSKVKRAERLYETERHLSDMTRQKEHLTERLGEMRERNAELKTEVADSKAGQAALLNRVNKLLESLDEKDDAFCRINTEKNELVGTVTKEHQTNNQLEFEVEALKAAVQKASKELSILKSLDEEGDVFNIDVENDIMGDLANAQALDNQLESEVDALKTTVTKTKEKVNKLLDRIDKKDAALLSMTMEKNDIIEHLAKAQGLNDQLQSEVMGLKECHRRCE